MPFIINVSLSDVASGIHPKSDYAMLLQIVDPDMDFPDPHEPFHEVRQYQFLDLEEEDYDPEDMKISEAQAEDIAENLEYALEKGMDVVVHCHLGVCRSGAVAEVGTIMGFDDTGAYRQPNILVKKMLMQALDIYYY